MPYVSQNSVHHDELLSNVSVAFQQDSGLFVASRAFPNIDVQKQSDKYVVIPRGDFNRDEMQLRAGGTQSAGSTFKLSDDSYFADVYALHFDLDPQTRANADNEFMLESNITEFLTKKALIKKEVLFASNFMTTGKWTKDWTGAGTGNDTTTRTYWDKAESDPIGNIRAAATAQQQLTGFRPNTLVLGRAVLDALELHPDVIDRVKYGAQTDISIASMSHLKQLFQVEEILVMDAIQNTAAMGATDSHSFIGGKNALLMYRPSVAGMMIPSAGYTFSWAGMEGAAGLGTSITKEEVPNTRGTMRYEIQMAFAMKKVAADMGTFFSAIVQ